MPRSNVVVALGLFATPAFGAAPTSAPEPTVLASQQWSPHDLAVDGANVYFTDSNGVTKAPVAGGAPGVLSSSENFPSSVVVHDANVYFATAGSTSLSGATGKSTVKPPTIRKIPVAGGAATTFAPLQQPPSSLAVDATNLYWVDCTGAVTALAPASGKDCGVSNWKPLIAVDATNGRLCAGLRAGRCALEASTNPATRTTTPPSTGRSRRRADPAK